MRDRTFAALENLPVAKDEPKSPDNSRRAPRGFPTGTGTVLVVEDQSQVQSFIVTVLRRLGYTVFDAANGSEAIALAVKAPTIDLVLTDLLLPGGMNGHEIARQVRKRIEVVVAADGREGLKAYLANPTDVVVTDILMPEKEGIETIIELKREHPNVKIVAISGGDPAGNTDFLEMAGLLGADRILQKPFRPKELLATIEDLFAAG